MWAVTEEVGGSLSTHGKPLGRHQKTYSLTTICWSMCVVVITLLKNPRLSLKEGDMGREGVGRRGKVVIMYSTSSP